MFSTCFFNLFILSILKCSTSIEDQLDALKEANSYYSEAIMTYYNEIAEKIKKQSNINVFDFSLLQQKRSADQLYRCLAYFNNFFKDVVFELLKEDYDDIDLGVLKGELDNLASYIGDAIRRDPVTLEDGLLIRNNLVQALEEICVKKILLEENYFINLDELLKTWTSVFSSFYVHFEDYFHKINILKRKRNDIIEQRMRFQKLKS